MTNESPDIAGTFDDPNWQNPGRDDAERAYFERKRQEHITAKALAARFAPPPAKPVYGDPNFKPLAGFRPLSQPVRKVAAVARATRKAQNPSRTGLRVIEAAVTIQASDYRPEVAYQHTVLCQTCLPFKNPGEVREWNRSNGRVQLSLEAGKAMHPEQGFIPVGLPFGAKPRLILAYLNTRAVLSQSPVIEVESSLRAFSKEIGLDTTGRELRVIKDQLARLAASRITLGVVVSPTEARTINTNFVQSFNLWFPKAENQRLLWPTNITLSTDYFESLKAHAVPLDLNALGALAHSALALDAYAWLGQRLHRVDPRAPSFITWAALRAQFGPDFTRVRKFRETFLAALRQVKAVYPAAKLDHDTRGLTIHYSAPPIQKRLVQVSALPNLEAEQAARPRAGLES